MFSVGLIVRDEALSLPRLFSSLQELKRRGGEVVVLDTGSKDATVEMARSWGCRVFERPGFFDSRLTTAQAREIRRRFERDRMGRLVRSGQPLFHFGEARQALNDLASHDYVLQVDGSDEFLSLDIDFLNRCITEKPPSRFSYRLRVYDVRFAASRFGNRRTCRWVGRAHETLISELREPVGQTLDEGVLHLRHHRNESKGREHYLPSLALNVLEDPENVNWLHYLGRELVYGKRYRSALPLLRRHADSEGAPRSERSESLCLLAASLSAMGCVRESAGHYLEAFQVDSTRRQPLLRLAELSLQRSDFQAVVAFANAALSVPDGNPYLESEHNYACGPHALLYWALFWLGRREEARVHWLTCRRLAPDDQRYASDAALFGETPSA